MPTTRTMLTSSEVRRRLADPGLPDRLGRLRFRDEDVAEVLALSRAVAAEPELLDVLARYANRLVELIGDFRQHPQVWEDVPVWPDLPAGALPMFALLVSVDEVSAWHRGRGVGEDASYDALADLGQQVHVHRLVHGVFGLHGHGWLTWAWSGAFYWLGRLQFNLQRTELDPQTEPQWVLSAHIPRGGPLDVASVDDAFAQATAFFARHFGEYPAEYFYCESWLLDPALPELLPGTNLAAFQRRWRRFGDVRPGNDDVLLFVFDRRSDSPSAGLALPSQTSLQRAAAAKIETDDPWVVAKGVIPVSDLTTSDGTTEPDVARQALGTLLPGFLGTTLPSWLAELLRRGLAGVCLFGQNIDSPEQTRRLTDAIHAANPRVLIAIDEEGGDVTRLFVRTGSPQPGNAVLGRLDDEAMTRASGAEIARSLREIGACVNFAPSVEINSNPDNPVIGVRSFGVDPGRVAAHGAAWIEGLQSAGVAATAKHFPGHGDTDADSHVALPRVDRSLAELFERELVPFQAAVRAGVKLVMTSHIVLPQLDAEQPATMSPLILDVLRSDLGFEGVIVTDALDMAGAQATLDTTGTTSGLAAASLTALSAGCDLLCLGTENTPEELTQVIDEIVTGVAEERLTLDRLSQAAARVSRLAEELAAGIGVEASDRAPGFSVDENAPAVADVLTVFERQPGVALPRLSDSVVIRVEAEASLAIGGTPWAPALAMAAEQLALDPGHLAMARIAPGRPVIVLGRNLHLNLEATAFIDALRQDREQVLVVEMGWPADDRRYADLATFGASALIGSALTRYLDAR